MNCVFYLSDLKYLIYTFRTFPQIAELQKLGTVIVLGKLKQDIQELYRYIELHQPDLIIGVATTTDLSRFESKAVNIFNRGKVSREGVEEYPLNIPINPFFRINTKYTTTFCNWAMYKIAEFKDVRNLSLQHQFIHLNLKDLTKLHGVLNSVE